MQEVIEIEPDWNTVLLLVLGYLSAFLVSTAIVRVTVHLLARSRVKENMKRDVRGSGIKILDTGLVIGLCENFIIITFILLNEITGLSLIFAAKTIVRYKGISTEPEYYLIGTMMNFSVSLFMGVILKHLFAMA